TYGNWLVETTDATVQLRVTKRGAAQLHRAPADRTRDLAHDRTPPHLIAADDPLFTTLGAGAAKRRQVDAFLRAVTGSLPESDQLRVADLGCGNAYLTFAMYRYLVQRGRAAKVIGVDVRDDQRRRNTELAATLDCAADMRFLAAGIAEADLGDIDVALALHACDTATDDALARGVKAGAARIFAAPCCHHDIAAQLKESTAPAPYEALTTDGILRERFADVLTDTVRALLLRMHGYHVDVVEFIDSAHTPRNTLIRARRTRTAPHPRYRAEYEALVAQWNVRPALARLLSV
ncbi:MAG: class I SAM-dependent methyltransferase, partial [Stackebrandtia sp.]